jgi:chromosome segregation ATPase
MTRGGGSAATQRVTDGAGTSWTGSTAVDVAALRLQPGETVQLQAEAVDASPWAQHGVSRAVILKRATMEEQRGAARALGDSAVEEARAVASAQRALAQRTDEAARAQARQGTSRSAQEGSAPSASSASGEQKGGMTYENAEKARALAQEQRAMADRVQKLREATQQLQRQLKTAGALDSGLARELAEAQAMLRQALTPQLLAQMQKLEGAAQQMNGEQSRDALRDLAQMQQRLREQLERSAEVLKRAAHEGAMQTLGDRARELAARERALADSAGQRADRKAAESREAATLAEQSERLREQIDGLKDRLAKDRAEAGAARTAQAQDHAAKSE